MLFFNTPASESFLVFHRGNGLVQHIADIVLEVLEGRHRVAVLIRPGLMPGAPRTGTKNVSP